MNKLKQQHIFQAVEKDIAYSLLCSGLNDDELKLTLNYLTLCIFHFLLFSRFITIFFCNASYSNFLWKTTFLSLYLNFFLLSHTSFIFSLHTELFKRLIIIWNVDLHRERLREVFHLLIHCISGHKSYSWADPRPGASWGFPMRV